MGFTPYLHFFGTCEDALNTYAEIFETSAPEFFRFRDAPQEGMPPVDGEWIMHGSVKKNGFTIAACDVPESYYSKPNGVSVAYNVETFDDGLKVFTALSKHATITMPYEKTFFAEGFGMLTDKFGIQWMIAVGDM